LKDTIKRLDLLLREHENNRAKLCLVNEKINEQLSLPPEITLGKSLNRLLESHSKHKGAIEMFAAALDIDLKDTIHLQESIEKIIRYHEEVSSAIRKLRSIWQANKDDANKKQTDAEIALNLCNILGS